MQFIGGLSMTPTPKLRFVERDFFVGLHEVKTFRILQQWWEIENITDALHNNILDGEWRDVPLEEEK
jgi:hypothetical protein